MENNTLILGAGVSGLTAARILKDKGIDVTLIDKGRGVGGRLATRWLGERDHITGRWDHGAQFATFRDPELIDKLKQWQSWDLMEDWLPGYADPTLARKRPREGMNAFAKALASDFTIHRGEQISRIEKKADRWILHSNSGKTFQASRLISTIPIPQFLELAETSGLKISEEESQELHGVQYERCLSLRALLDGPSGLTEPGRVRVHSGILETLIDQHQKGISTAHTLVANATPAFSLEWFRRDRNTAASVLRAAVQEKIQAKILSVQIHGWKFSRPIHRIPKNYLQLENGIVLAGDGFAAGTPDTSPTLPPRIESTMLSGMAAAKNTG